MSIVLKTKKGCYEIPDKVLKKCKIPQKAFDKIMKKKALFLCGVFLILMSFMFFGSPKESPPPAQ